MKPTSVVGATTTTRLTFEGSSPSSMLGSCIWAHRCKRWRCSGWKQLPHTYLYRAIDSAGETIEFMLSPKRDLIAAKLFLRLPLYGGGPSPRVINVDGHAAYARHCRVEADG